MEGRRGLGGGGTFEADGDREPCSLDKLRRATGLRGGIGGMYFALVFEATESRFSVTSASVSVCERGKRDGLCEGALVSPSEKSMRFSCDSGTRVWVAFRGGSCGLFSGTSSPCTGGHEFTPIRLSCSMSRSEAAIAALRSGSSSSSDGTCDLAVRFVPLLPLLREDGFDDRSPARSSMDESKNPFEIGVVTSLINTPRTRPGFSRTKSV